MDPLKCSADSQPDLSFRSTMPLRPDLPPNISSDNVSMARYRNLFVCNTRIGPFYIAEAGGRFHPVYEDESLGSYARPEQAAEDVAGGHTFSISSGIDTATLGIPEDPSEWRKVG